MTAATDRTLSAVRAALGAAPRRNAASAGIVLGLRDGVLTMEGEVADVSSKKLALERAAAVPGVAHIVDRLRIAPARRMSDDEIRGHVCDAFMTEPAFQGCALSGRTGPQRPRPAALAAARVAVEVSVDRGVVTLAGVVPSLAHKRLAGVLAWWVPGTRDVVNGLEVVPPEEDSDDEITDAVRLVLEKDPLVEAAGIRVTTHDACVTLEGVAGSPEQREMAEIDAWCVFGVDRVVDRLVVRASEHAPR